MSTFSHLTLQNRNARAEIHTRVGGYIQSLMLENPDHSVVSVLSSEHIPKEGSGWPMGGMPILFPFAGRQYDLDKPFQYALDGTSYPMPLHGFAYGEPWTLVHQEKHRAHLRLEDDQGTRALYPFGFTFDLWYELFYSELKVSWSITHREPSRPKGMPLNLGFHPFFSKPFLEGSRLDCVSLICHAEKEIEVTAKGLAGKVSNSIFKEQQAGVSLHNPHLKQLILAELRDPFFKIMDRDSKLELKVEWSPKKTFEYLVLWTREGDSFHCVEPWMGLPDALKEGHGAQYIPCGHHLEGSLILSLKHIET